MLLFDSQVVEVSYWLSQFDVFLTKNLPTWAVLAIEFVLVAVALLTLYAVLALILIYVERKITAFFQARLGPNRVGKYGLVQSVADMVKILIKEIIHVRQS
ncbi:MAG: NADH-quinone oxidoreductase subunit H, partial [Dysgonomonas mossii]|nr:NADH-quinone oxidoreductase subunit H [Dysgonomonas mossii]